jgi:hypothetical protein
MKIVSSFLTPILLACLLTTAISSTAFAQINLTGDWRDSNGGEIHITHSGNQVVATGKNEAVTRWWDRGTATLSGQSMTMTHTHRGRVVDTVTGTARDANYIQWSNGSDWQRTSEPGRDSSPIAAPPNLMKYRGQVGQQFRFAITGTSDGTVWGSDNSYTLDSKLSTAAVHAGLLASGQRRTITVKIHGSKQSFRGSTSNGVTSSQWGPFDGSFSFESEGNRRQVMPSPSPNPSPSGDIRYDQVTFLATHNAYANYEDARWTGPSQSHSIKRQLDNGVRALELDVWYWSCPKALAVASLGLDDCNKGLFLCHGGCGTVAGVTYALPRQRFSDTLRTVRDWLNGNPKEIVTIFLETGGGDYGVNQGLMDAALNEVGGNFYSMIYNPERDAQWKLSEKGWPTIKWMVQNNKRLVIYSGGGHFANQYITNFTNVGVRNKWSLGGGGNNTSVESYGNAFNWNPGGTTWTPVFWMSHHRDASTTFTAAIDNTHAKLSSRIQNKAIPAAGRKPNYLFVDFYEIGSARQVVNALNPAGWNAIDDRFLPRLRGSAAQTFTHKYKKVWVKFNVPALRHGETTRFSNGSWYRDFGFNVDRAYWSDVSFTCMNGTVERRGNFGGDDLPSPDHGTSQPGVQVGPR